MHPRKGRRPPVPGVFGDCRGPSLHVPEPAHHLLQELLRVQQSQQVSPVHGRAVQAARKAQIRGEAGRGAAQFEGRTQRVDGGTQ